MELDRLIRRWVRARFSVAASKSLAIVACWRGSEGGSSSDALDHWEGFRR